jgi:hypothetical protein
MMGENSKSTALGVESVWRNFRYAPSNRTRGRFSAFSPCQREATVLTPENGAAKNAYNRTHSFCGFDGSVSVGLDLLELPFYSAHSVVKIEQDAEATSSSSFTHSTRSTSSTNNPKLKEQRK